MNRDKALGRIRKLLALAAKGSGATEEEARTAAVQAARLMQEHGLAPGSVSAGSGSATSNVDDLEILALKLRVQALERVIGDRQVAHLKEIAARDEMWVNICDGVRRADDAEAKMLTKKATMKAAQKEREDLARSGGRARARSLDPLRKTEIARVAAKARWAKWRAKHG